MQMSKTIHILFLFILLLCLSACAANPALDIGEESPMPSSSPSTSPAPTPTDVSVLESIEPTSAVDETASSDSPVYTDVNDLKFADLAGVEFWFGSGAGAWGTEVEIYPDGTFKGYYHDSEAGSIGDDHPNGSRYECYFSGKFTELKKAGDYTYSMRCDTLITEGTPDEEKIENGVRVITSGPNGFDNADEFFLYLPGKKTENLPEEFVYWIHWVISGDEITNGVITSYVLRNVGAETGFMGNQTN